MDRKVAPKQQHTIYLININVYCYDEADSCQCLDILQYETWVNNNQAELQLCKERIERDVEQSNNDQAGCTYWVANGTWRVERDFGSVI